MPWNLIYWHLIKIEGALRDSRTSKCLLWAAVSFDIVITSSIFKHFLKVFRVTCDLVDLVNGINVYHCLSPFVVGCNDLNSPCFWIKWPRTSHSLHNQHYWPLLDRKLSFPLVKCTQKYQLLGHGSSKKSRPPLITIFFPKSQQEHASYSYFEHNFCSRQLCWGAIYPKNRGNTIQIFWAKE